MRRVRRDECHEEFVKSLTTGDAAVFREIWRLMVFAAALGVNAGIRKPLGKYDQGKAINESYFSVAGWKGILYLLGVSETGDTSVLRSSEESEESLVTLFEEYANEGLFMLREAVHSAASPLDDIVSLLIEKTKWEPSAPVVKDLI
jgi:dnd system-associated protein 4